MSPETDNWPYTREAGPSDNDPVIGPTPEAWKRNPWEPLPPAGVPITVRHITELEDRLLPIVGASQSLDHEGKWVNTRDEADTRVVSDYLSGDGSLVENESEVGGFPVIENGTPYQHTGDGISNEWKIANGFQTTDQIANTLVPAGNGVASGWTYMDMFLAGLNRADWE